MNEIHETVKKDVKGLKVVVGEAVSDLKENIKSEVKANISAGAIYKEIKEKKETIISKAKILLGVFSKNVKTEIENFSSCDISIGKPIDKIKETKEARISRPNISYKPASKKQTVIECHEEAHSNVSKGKAESGKETDRIDNRNSCSVQGTMFQIRKPR